jgi:hypothetical protein
MMTVRVKEHEQTLEELAGSIYVKKGGRNFW